MSGLVVGAAGEGCEGRRGSVVAMGVVLGSAVDVGGAVGVGGRGLGCVGAGLWLCTGGALAEWGRGLG